MPTYLCTDGHAELEIAATDAQSAAQEYIDGGDWNVVDKTIWINVQVTEISETESFTIEVNPEEPACTENEHDFQSPHSVVGGLESNPGVYGKQGGCVITEVCANCGLYRITDTWAQNRETGEQGLTSIEYREADGKSENWIG